jgi:hypothetical protein
MLRQARNTYNASDVDHAGLHACKPLGNLQVAPFTGKHEWREAKRVFIAEKLGKMLGKPPRNVQLTVTARNVKRIPGHGVSASHPLEDVQMPASARRHHGIENERNALRAFRQKPLHNLQVAKPRRSNKRICAVVVYVRI